MNHTSVQYLIELTTTRRDQASAFFYSDHLSPVTKQHWRDELQRAENALAALSSLPIT